MQTKKKIVLFGCIVILGFACFLTIGNESLGDPEGSKSVELYLPNTSDVTNLDVLNSVFDAKNNFYSSNEYLKQIYSNPFYLYFHENRSDKNTQIANFGSSVGIYPTNQPCA